MKKFIFTCTFFFIPLACLLAGVDLLAQPADDRATCNTFSIVAFDPETNEWVLEEFLGEWWFEKTKKLCGQSVSGNSGAKSGHLLRIAPIGASEGARKVGKRLFEEKRGLFAPGAVTWEMRSFAGKRAAEVTKQTGTGLYGVPVEVKRVNGVNSMKMRYTDPDHPELGHHNAGNLVLKQKARGLPHGKENRRKVQ
jgi:hypothetical protein